MSQEKVELIERLIDAFDRHDPETLQALCHDDFEFVSVLTVVDADAAIYRGADAWANYFKAVDEMWSDWGTADVRIFDPGGDRLACLFHLVGTGRASGVPVDRAVGITYEIRDGKVWRLRSYPNPREALEAVGLSE
jgi:ketosteroid isomerase-like protein